MKGLPNAEVSNKYLTQSLRYLQRLRKRVNSIYVSVNYFIKPKILHLTI